MMHPYLRIILILLIMVGSISAVQAQAISGQELINAARQTIIDRLGEGDYEVSPPANIPEYMEVPEGNISLKTEIPYAIRYSTPTLVSVAISTDDQRYASIGLSFIIKKYENIAVASADIANKEPLGPQNVCLERTDVGRLSQGYITNLDKLQGLVAKRALIAGTVINDYTAELPVVVKRGTGIMIIAKVGNVTVAAQGEALQNGRAGQIIRARNMNTKKIVFIKVIDGSCGEVPLYHEQSR